MYLSKTFTSKEIWSLFSQNMFPGWPVWPMRNRGYAEVCCLASRIECQCLQKEAFHFPKTLILTSKALREKINIISWDLFSYIFSFVWGSGSFLCFPAILIIRGPCFENERKQTKKKKQGKWVLDCKDPENDALTCEMNSSFHTSSGWTTHEQSEPKKTQRLWSQIKNLILASQA